MPDQPTFADLDYACTKRKTRREMFLERMDGLIPWGQLEEQIRPYHPTAGRGGRPDPLSTMLRVHCVQLFYNLSDPGMEDLLYWLATRPNPAHMGHSSTFPPSRSAVHRAPVHAGGWS